MYMVIQGRIRPTCFLAKGVHVGLTGTLVRQRNGYTLLSYMYKGSAINECNKVNRK